MVVISLEFNGNFTASALHYGANSFSFSSSSYPLLSRSRNLNFNPVMVSMKNELEFKPSFDQYLKAMESVKNNTLVKKKGSS